MEQGAILQHLPSDSFLPSDNECIEPFPGAHHTSYTNGGAIDSLRRDGSVQQPDFALTTAKNIHGARFVSDGGVGSDANSYRTGNNFSDSSSGSISASPSSGVSSLAYNTAAHYTVPTYSSCVQLSQTALVPSFHAAHRGPPISHNGITGTLPPLQYIRPPISTVTNTSDRDSYPHSTPLLNRAQLSPSGYIPYTETPRSILSTTQLYSPQAGLYAHHMASSSSQNYPNAQNDCSNFPWPNLEVLLEMTCEGQGVTPEVHAKVEKGFFLAPGDQKWTCYRRNYFSVNCSFELHPNINNARMFLKRGNTSEQVQAMGMRLSAAVDGAQGKSIELIQHTPKRDNGPKSKIDVVKVSPLPSSGRQEQTLSPHGVYHVPMSTFHATGTVPSPYLPLQNTGESSGSTSSSSSSSQISGSYPYQTAAGHLPMPGQNTNHTFERVQFKQATANNGKRRASQQYFHLMVELFADVRKDGSDTPIWVKIAHRVSEKIVVRGRSPSHYQNEGQHGQGGRGSANGTGSYGAASGASYGSMNPSGFRSSAHGYGGFGSRGGHPSNHFGLHASSGESASSPESVEGGAMDSDHPMDAVMSDADRNGMQDVDGYSYHPGAIYENHPSHLPLPKIETVARGFTEPRQYAVKAEYPEAVAGPHWQAGAFGRFHGFDSSRGYYPDLAAGAANYS